MMRAPMAPMRGPTMQALAPVLSENRFAVIASFPALIELIREKRDPKLLMEIEEGIRLVHFAPGRIEFEPAPGAKPDLAARLAQRLQGWTGQRWALSVVGSGGQPTLREVREREQDQARIEVESDPLVMSVIAAFPGARVKDIRSAEAMAAEAETAALPMAEEVDEGWNPFEDD